MVSIRVKERQSGRHFIELTNKTVANGIITGQFMYVVDVAVVVCGLNRMRENHTKNGMPIGNQRTHTHTNE